MRDVIPELVEYLAGPRAALDGVLEFASPVPAFGDPASATVATLGLNPSDLEFLADDGTELPEDTRRLHTLRSLGLHSWEGFDSSHLSKIAQACAQYFTQNPYTQWFRPLSKVLSCINASYTPPDQLDLFRTEPTNQAVHLDVLPLATKKKWGLLGSHKQAAMLQMASDALGQLLQRSAINILICNGRSVVKLLERVHNLHCESTPLPSACSLPRRGDGDVRGVGFRGTMTRVGIFDLDREVTVLGYNHNLQSSFGVTSLAINGIASWIASELHTQIK